MYLFIYYSPWIHKLVRRLQDVKYAWPVAGFGFVATTNQHFFIFCEQPKG
jgi:hypothetical protein